jgi:predicted transporter
MLFIVLFYGCACIVLWCYSDIMQMEVIPVLTSAQTVEKMAKLQSDSDVDQIL